MSFEFAKAGAAAAAVDAFFDENVRVLGVGSGSTIKYALEKVAEIVKAKNRPLICVPTSFQAKELIAECGLICGELNDYCDIDLGIDGADEVDRAGNLIKGGGGCQLQEKAVASRCAVFVVVADDRKRSDKLGDFWKAGIPLEVSTFAYKPTMADIVKLGGTCVLRQALSKAGPCVTDNGNFIVDAVFEEMTKDAVKLEAQLNALPGVLGHGLFVGMTNAAFFGSADGSVVRVDYDQ